MKAFNRNSITGISEVFPSVSYSNALMQVMEELKQGVVVINAESRICYANHQAGILFNKTPEELVNLEIQKLCKTPGMNSLLRLKNPQVFHLPGLLASDHIGLFCPSNSEEPQCGGLFFFLESKFLADLKNKLVAENRKNAISSHYIRQDWSAKYSFDDIIGVSEKIKEAKEKARQVAATASTVLLIGESGTGKELFAHAIHALSRRKSSPFVRINCSSIPSELLEAEMFGYEAGAFTGAGRKGRHGLFEIADRGTIFLDEITQMKWDMQAKFLRVLQEKEILRVGGSKPVMVDFRLIVAVNTPFEELLRAGRFRSDLYYRINVFPIHIPPLRERKEDIPVLMEYFARRLQNDPGLESKRFSAEVFRVLKNFEWPGNVREIMHVQEQLYISSRHNLIGLKDLPPYLLEYKGKEDILKGENIEGNFKELMEFAEKKILMKTLEKVKGSKAKAARLLGIHRSGLYQKIKKYNLHY